VIADSCVYDHHAFTKFFRIGKYSSCLDREDVVCFLFCCLYTLRFLHVDKIKKILCNQRCTVMQKNKWGHALSNDDVICYDVVGIFSVKQSLKTTTTALIFCAT